MTLRTVCGFLLLAASASAGNFPREPASSFAGKTTTFQFPPANATPVTIPDPNYPDPAQVGFPGPTPTGDEAFAIATAPALAKVEGFDPIVRPNTSDNAPSTFNVVRSWGNLSPWQSLPAGTFGLPESSPVVPCGCDITQVHILHRHGARYPTSGSAPSAFAGKLQGVANSTGYDATGPLEFLATWQYKLGAEILTPLGRNQLYNLGVNARVRYGGLLKDFTEVPVWRTTSEERMVDSALQFAAGFFGVQQYQSSYHQVIEIEASGFNSTLAPYDVCPNSNLADLGGIGNAKAAQWAEVYTQSAIKRLSPYIKGVNLMATDIVAMQELCAYESVALGYSSFCNLFTEKEFKGFEYFFDIGFWYSNGPGGSTVAAQGVGYVQEFISRLTETRITDFDTSVNQTIVSNNTTFPLAQPIFVDASHDTVISAIAVALNLTSLARSGPLPLDHIAEDRQWIISHVAPFSTNLVAQVLSCPVKGSNSSAVSGKPTHVRWILNDAVVPLTGVQGCTEDKDGLCDLETYIASTKARIAEIDYQHDCFGNYSIPDPDLIVDGRAPR